ncbi:hypothetical protein V5O48_004600 [Marasmius crinis-equi]|uniref:Uncharacterized protein n=1 Tax=Marasmius crinis-equi TaxID=585013 RepID=A0ABR3FPQ9_9AGAR
MLRSGPVKLPPETWHAVLVCLDNPTLLSAMQGNSFLFSIAVKILYANYQLESLDVMNKNFDVWRHISVLRDGRPTPKDSTLKYPTDLANSVRRATIGGNRPPVKGKIRALFDSSSIMTCESLRTAVTGTLPTLIQEFRNLTTLTIRNAYFPVYDLQKYICNLLHISELVLNCTKDLGRSRRWYEMSDNEAAEGGSTQNIGSAKDYSAPIICAPITVIPPSSTTLTLIEAVRVDDGLPPCPTTLAFLVSVFQSKRLTSLKVDWISLKATSEFATKFNLVIFPPTLTSITVVADPDALIGTDDYLSHWSTVIQEDADLLYSLLKTVHTNIRHFAICSRNAELDYETDKAPSFPSLTSFEGCITHARNVISWGARALVTDLCIHQCQHDSLRGLECVNSLAEFFPSLRKFTFKYNGFDWPTERKHISAFKDNAVTRWPDIREIRLKLIRTDLFEHGLVQGLKNMEDANNQTLRPSLEWASEWALVADNLQALQIFMHDFRWTDSRHCRHRSQISVPIGFPTNDFPDVAFEDTPA